MGPGLVSVSPNSSSSVWQKLGWIFNTRCTSKCNKMKRNLEVFWTLAPNNNNNNNNNNVLSMLLIIISRQKVKLCRKIVVRSQKFLTQCIIK